MFRRVKGNVWGDETWSLTRSKLTFGAAKAKRWENEEWWMMNEESVFTLFNLCIRIWCPMNPVAVLLLHQRQQRRSSASLSMWPAIPEPCRHRNIASSAGPWRRGHATPHKRLSCLVFHNELHELDEFHCSLLSFILHSSFFIWRSAPSFFTSEFKNSCNL